MIITIRGLRGPKKTREISVGTIQYIEYKMASSIEKYKTASQDKMTSVTSQLWANFNQTAGSSSSDGNTHLQFEILIIIIIIIIIVITKLIAIVIIITYLIIVTNATNGVGVKCFK